MRVCVWSQNSENEFDVWLDMATLSASAHPPTPSTRLLEEKYRRALLLILRKKAVELSIENGERKKERPRDR